MNRALRASALFVRMALMMQELMSGDVERLWCKENKSNDSIRTLGKANFRAGQSGHVHASHCSEFLLFSGRIPIMPNKVVETPYPLIDADPHASRVIRYFRPSDYAAWAGSTAAFPAAIYAWGMKFSQLFRLPSFLTKHPELADPTKFRMKTTIKLGGFLGFTAGFLFAYQRSSRACILQ